MTKLFRFYNGRWRCGHLTLCHNGLHDLVTNIDTNKALVVTVSKEPSAGSMTLVRKWGDVGYHCVGYQYYFNGTDVQLPFSVILELGDFNLLYVTLEQAS